MGRAVGEGFGAVAGLEEEALAELGVGDEGFEPFDLPGGDEWGECAETLRGARERFGVGIGDGLRVGTRGPGIERPGVVGGGLHAVCVWDA